MFMPRIKCISNINPGRISRSRVASRAGNNPRMIRRAVAGIGAIVGRGSVIIASVTVLAFLGCVGAGRRGTYRVSLKELAKS